jgi:hypothetical protein
MIIKDIMITEDQLIKVAVISNSTMINGNKLDIVIQCLKLKFHNNKISQKILRPKP